MVVGSWVRKCPDTDSNCGCTCSIMLTAMEAFVLALGEVAKEAPTASWLFIDAVVALVGIDVWCCYLKPLCHNLARFRTSSEHVTGSAF